MVLSWIVWKVPPTLSLLALAIDSAWATPVNTALLIVVTVISQRTHRQAKAARQSGTYAASAGAAAALSAQSAAQAAADSARIAKELGGTLRNTSPLTGPGDGSPS